MNEQIKTILKDNPKAKHVKIGGYDFVLRELVEDELDLYLEMVGSKSKGIGFVVKTGMLYPSPVKFSAILLEKPGIKYVLNKHLLTMVGLELEVEEKN